MTDGRLPTFLIIGAMKAGTSALYGGLARHPEVFTVPNKEVYYFDRDDVYARGLDWYRRQFAGSDGKRAVGEASPSYMFVPAAAPRIAATLPGVKLVAILRDPVARAYSHYGHERFYAREQRPFAQAIADELAGSDEGFSYVARGRYLEQLQRVCDHVPRASLLVLLSDDLKDGDATYARLFRFLEIDDTIRIADPGVVNPYRENRFPRAWRFMMRHRMWRKLGPLRVPVTRAFIRQDVTPPPVDPDTERRLRDYFAEENAALGAWLGRDLSAWNAGKRAGARP